MHQNLSRVFSSDKEKQKYTGAYYTPTIWANEAHKEITKIFGKNWKEEYIVWDPACGTGNLTRDYKFKELYLSTLYQEDIDFINHSNYNPEATKFQYDFLNNIEWQYFLNNELVWDTSNFSLLPSGLQNALQFKKKIIILMNPPYVSSGIMGTTGDHKGGVTMTEVRNDMKKNDLLLASQDLCIQFLFKIMQFQTLNQNMNIVCFTKPLFLIGMTYKKMRNEFLTKFEYRYGFLFSAGHFDGTSKAWGVLFSIWTPGETQDKINFLVDLKDVIDTDD